MTEILQISKAPKLISSKDYQFLRAKGIEYIQKYAGDVWTDHNIHDPGITILEAACFAITELGFRIDLDIKDILQSSPATGNGVDFFSVPEILPTHPITLNDFRKLLIDLPEIKNAWIEIADKVKPNLFYNENTQQLDLTTGTPVDLNGLYEVLIEIKEDENLGNLNSSIIQLGGKDGLPIPLGGGEFEQVFVEVAFPFWEEEAVSGLTDEVSLDTINIISNPPLQENPNTGEYFAEIQINYNTTESTSFGVIIKIIAEFEEGLLPIIEATIQNELLKTLDGPIGTLNQKIIQANAILNRTKLHLSAYRNLGEDFYKYRATQIQEIAINANLEVGSSINGEALLAEIYFAIDKFLSPEIRFSSFEELSSKGKTIEEIFNGPLLEHGFLEEEILEGLKGRSVIYASDLIRIILERNGTEETLDFRDTSKPIISVQNFSITNFLNNLVLTNQAKNCLNLFEPTVYKPRLSITKSSIRLYRNGIELTIDIAKVIQLFVGLKSEILNSGNIVNPLPTPALGQPLPIENYQSLQNDLPETYATRPKSLDLTSTEERKAKAKQLKAYLVLFDQVLANLVAQFASIRQLLSISNQSKDTYFYQIPNDISLFNDLTSKNYEVKIQENTTSFSALNNRRGKILDHLLARFGEQMNTFEALRLDTDTFNEDKKKFLQAYANLSGLRSNAGLFPRLSEFNIQRQKDGQYSWTWPKFNSPNQLTSPPNSIYSNLFDLFEAIQDVLALAIVDSNYHTAGPTDALQIKLCETQIDSPDATKKTVAVSTTTYDGNAATAEAISKWVRLFSGPWNTEQRSTVEKKICHLLGFNDCRIRDLWGRVDAVFQIIEEPGGTFGFLVEDNAANPLFRSEDNNFLSREAVMTIIYEVIQFGQKAENYELLGSAPNLSFRLQVNSNTLGVAEGGFLNENIRNTAIMNLVSILKDNFTEEEGFHLIEHILLRPDEGALESIFQIVTTGVPPNQTFGYQVFDKENNLLLQSENNNFNDISLNATIQRVLQFGRTLANYKTIGNAPNLSFQLIDDKNELLGISATNYPNIDAINVALQELIERFSQLLKIPIDSTTGIKIGDLKDPYSFQLTVALPAGAGRFSEPRFRQLVEETFYRELPAHLLPRILWLDIKNFHQLETAYKNWLTHWVSVGASPSSIKPFQVRLIAAIDSATQAVLNE